MINTADNSSGKHILVFWKKIIKLQYTIQINFFLKYQENIFLLPKCFRNKNILNETEWRPIGQI